MDEQVGKPCSVSPLVTTGRAILSGFAALGWLLVFCLAHCTFHCLLTSVICGVIILLILLKGLDTDSLINRFR